MFHYRKVGENTVGVSFFASGKSLQAGRWTTFPVWNSGARRTSKVHHTYKAFGPRAFALCKSDVSSLVSLSGEARLDIVLVTF